MHSASSARTSRGGSWQHGPRATSIAVDREPPGPLVERLLGDARDRLESCRPTSPTRRAFDGIGHVDVIVHAATVTHVPEWEVATPRRYIDTNLLGTTNLLEWARDLPGLARLVYVSTGGVYGNQTPASSASPQSRGRAVRTAHPLRHDEVRGRAARTPLRRAVRVRPAHGQAERGVRPARATDDEPHRHVGGPLAGARRRRRASAPADGEDARVGRRSRRRARTSRTGSRASRSRLPPVTTRTTSRAGRCCRSAPCSTARPRPGSRPNGRWSSRPTPSSTSIPRSSARAGTPMTSRAHARISAGSRDRSPCSCGATPTGSGRAPRPEREAARRSARPCAHRSRRRRARRPVRRSR